MEKETSNDFYAILQVNPKADDEIIDRAYRLLAKRYHPDNKDTGDPAKFDILMKAYLVLSDPEQRATYDASYEAFQLHQRDLFLNAPQPGNAVSDRRVYQAILSILYISRRRDTLNPGVAIVYLEKLLGIAEKQLEFQIWYLKEKGWVQRIETGELAITASGVDAVIENEILLRKDRLLPSPEEISSNRGEAEEFNAIRTIAGNLPELS